MNKNVLFLCIASAVITTEVAPAHCTRQSIAAIRKSLLEKQAQQKKALAFAKLIQEQKQLLQILQLYQRIQHPSCRIGII